MWIVKIGGSWLKNPELPKLINLLKNFSSQKMVLVVGGGVFADSVREFYRTVKMSECTGHLLAMKATELFAYYLKSINPEIHLTENIEHFVNDKINLWLPSDRMHMEECFEKSWESTSDSIATWLYTNTQADGLIFVKSINFEKKKSINLIDLQKKKIIDLNIKNYLYKKKNLKIVGPEFIEFLKIHSKWDLVISNLKEIEL
jgi:aspartokinase-like uncharacterized kinase